MGFGLSAIVGWTRTFALGRLASALALGSATLPVAAAAARRTARRSSSATSLSGGSGRRLYSDSSTRRSHERIGSAIALECSWSTVHAATPSGGTAWRRTRTARLSFATALGRLSSAAEIVARTTTCRLGATTGRWSWCERAPFLITREEWMNRQTDVWAHAHLDSERP